MTRVRQASTEISIATRRFEFDAVGQMLLAELEYCCQRGLRVRCLLDGDESAGFITGHPRLFSALETRFRSASLDASPTTCLIFDRSYALTGDFPLCAAVHDEALEWGSTATTGEAAAVLAQAFDASWERARDSSPLTS